MKVLVSAYSCEPGQGSEPGVGWNVVREVARYHEVWVLTRPDESGDIIEAELVRHPVPNLHFVYFSVPFWTSGWRWGAAIHLHYYLWQIRAYFIARRLHRDLGFDLIHHVTFVKYSIPSFLCLLPLPFIWGPVGGGESAPKTFWSDFNLRAKIYESLRNAARWLGEQDPFVQITARRSSIALATTEDTAVRLKALKAKQVQVVGQCGLSQEEIDLLANLGTPGGTPLRFISLGRLLHWKGFYLGLRGFALAAQPNAEYWIVGEGPEDHSLRQLAQNLGIAHQVKFWGRLSRQDTLQRLGECHVLVHPSLHDSGGFVCLEALAAARPVICLDLGGPATQVTEATGFKIAANHSDQVVQDIAAAMTRLVQNPDLRIQMGQAGQQRIREVYSWKVKGQFLAQLYENIVTP